MGSMKNHLRRNQLATISITISNSKEDDPHTKTESLASHKQGKILICLGVFFRYAEMQTSEKEEKLSGNKYVAGGWNIECSRESIKKRTRLKKNYPAQVPENPWRQIFGVVFSNYFPLWQLFACLALIIQMAKQVHLVSGVDRVQCSNLYWLIRLNEFYKMWLI